MLKFGSFGFKINCYKRYNFSNYVQVQLIVLKKLKQLNNNKKIKSWSNLNFNMYLTKLTTESRMGKGKGNIYERAIFFKPGDILYEFDKTYVDVEKQLFKHLNKKLFTKIYSIRKYNS